MIFLICVYTTIDFCFCFSSRRRHTRCALVTGVQTCALPICWCSCRASFATEGASHDHSVRLSLFQLPQHREARAAAEGHRIRRAARVSEVRGHAGGEPHRQGRSEEHTSELQSLMRISYAVFCLKKKNKSPNRHMQLAS